MWLARHAVFITQTHTDMTNAFKINFNLINTRFDGFLKIIIITNSSQLFNHHGNGVNLSILLPPIKFLKKYLVLLVCVWIKKQHSQIYLNRDY